MRQYANRYIDVETTSTLNVDLETVGDAEMGLSDTAPYPYRNGCEMAVAATLWDVFDEPGDNRDTLNRRFADIFTAFHTKYDDHYPYDINEWWHGWRKASLGSEQAILANFADHKISVDTPNPNVLIAPVTGSGRIDIVSKEAVFWQSVSLVRPKQVDVCGNCQGGESTDIGLITEGQELILSHNGHLSTDTAWARVLDKQSGPTYVTWTLGFEDRDPNGGDYNDLVVKVIIENLNPPYEGGGGGGEG